MPVNEINDTWQNAQPIHSNFSWSHHQALTFARPPPLMFSTWAKCIPTNQARIDESGPTARIPVARRPGNGDNGILTGRNFSGYDSSVAHPLSMCCFVVSLNHSCRTTVSQWIPNVGRTMFSACWNAACTRSLKENKFCLDAVFQVVSGFRSKGSMSGSATYPGSKRPSDGLRVFKSCTHMYSSMDAQTLVPKPTHLKRLTISKLSSKNVLQSLLESFASCPVQDDPQSWTLPKRVGTMCTAAPVE